MNTILLTGSSGFLGSRLLRYLQENTDDRILSPSHSELDISSSAACFSCLSETKPDFVIHLAALSDVGTCTASPELSYSVNYKGSCHLAAACKEAGSRFIYASSDQVYTGNHTDRLNCETDSCIPENIYGQHKLMTEQTVQELLPSSVALRLAWMYDLQPGKNNYLKNMIKAIRTGALPCPGKNCRPPGFPFLLYRRAFIAVCSVN